MFIRWFLGQEATWVPWHISEANLLYWRKYLWHCWHISVPPAVIRWPQNTPPLPPHYALLEHDCTEIFQAKMYYFIAATEKIHFQSKNKDCWVQSQLGTAISTDKFSKFYTLKLACTLSRNTQQCINFILALNCHWIGMSDKVSPIISTAGHIGFWRWQHAWVIISSVADLSWFKGQQVTLGVSIWELAQICYALNIQEIDGLKHADLQLQHLKVDCRKFIILFRLNAKLCHV